MKTGSLTAQVNMDIWSFVLFLTVLAAFTVDVSHQGPDQDRLYGYLLRNYSPLWRPVVNDSEAITIRLGINLLQILDLDERTQVLKTNMWIKMEWDDYHLRWKESDYPHVTNLRFPDHLLWKPDIMLFNSADEKFEPAVRTNIIVNPQGHCSYVPPGIFKSTCSIDMSWFPFDIQRCELKFGSWTYNGFALDLQLDDADINGYIPNGEWDLVEVPGKRHERIYECCPEPYTDITFTLVMRRRTLYYAVNLLIPCVLISTLALLVFVLPADSGEKISLGITVLLSLTVFMLRVADVIPPTSDSVPLIAQYFATIMVLVGLSVIATVVVLQFHHHDPNGSKMPKWVRVFLLNWCAWFLRMKRPGREQERSACHNKAPQNRLTNIDLGAATTGHYSTAATSPDSGNLVGHPGEDEKLLHAHRDVSSTETALAKIMEEVQLIAKHFRDQDEEKAVCNEWKFAASVIDRLCLVAFSVITILCTIGILMSAPNFAEAISKDF